MTATNEGVDHVAVDKFSWESDYLTEDGRRIRDRVRALIPTLRRNAAEGEQLGMLAPETLQAMDAAGVFKIGVPKELGGFALTVRDTVETYQALAQGDGAAGWLGWISTAGIRQALALPQEGVDEVLGQMETHTGPLLCGSSAVPGAAAAGSARKVDGGWLVSGRWPFASGSKHAAWAAVGVDYEDGDAAKRHAIAYLSRDQFTILDDWHVMGMKGTASNSIAVTGNVFVPEHRLQSIADFVNPSRRIQRRYAGNLFRPVSGASLLIITLGNVAVGLGLAQGAMECFVEQAKKRKPFNLPYPSLTDMPSIHVTTAKVQSQINAAEAVIHKQADDLDRRIMAGEDILPSKGTVITLDLVYALHQCVSAIDSLQLALGSSTVSLKNPIQRFLRDARTMATHGAVRLDPMAEIVGRQMMGCEPFPMPDGLAQG